MENMKIFKNLNYFPKLRRLIFQIQIQYPKLVELKLKGSKCWWDEIKVGNCVDVVQLVDYTPWESSYDNPIGQVNEPCHQLWHRMFVWYDGKVNPCDYDYKSKLSKWNVNNNKISEIWNSSEYNNYRNMHLKSLRKDLYPCDRCTFGNA